MKQTFLPKVSEAVRVNIRHRQWQHALLAMAAVVVFITVYMLILPAITMTGPTCGLEEHTHSDSCYELRLVCGLEETPEGDTAHVHGPACYEQQQVLTCGQEEGSGHTHTDACMGCVCGQEEGAGHTHTDACYADVTVEELTCTQEESAGHTHDASCYTVEEELTCGMSEGEGGHEHDDGCCDPETGELTCGMSEGEGGHEHDEGCYTQTETLTCTQEESAGHTHDASCYTQTVERQLVCGQEETEGHVHTDACMGYTCGQEESAGHTHTEACYTTQDVLICGESAGHTHTDACYEQVLVCQIPEHTHTEECYASGEEAPVEEIPEEDVPLGEYACGKEEHAHTQDCYDAGGNLICALEEHTHDESCLAEELPEYICGKEEHAHTEDCYDAGGNLICALEEHAHDETCLPVEQEPGAFPEELPEGYGEYEYEDADTGLSVLAYAPEGAFEEDVELQAQVLDQDSDAYADAQANLEEAGDLDEDTSMVALDIAFRTAGGDEVEPDPAAGPVYVRLDARALIPDGVDESTVAVQHHAETTDGGLFGTGLFAGTEVEVETVADSSGDTGEVTLTPSARPLAAPLSLPAETEEAPEEEAAQEGTAALDVEAKFAVDGFSTFTITWGTSANAPTATVYYVDENGSQLEGSEGETITTANDAVTLEAIADDFIGSSGYQQNRYQYALLNYSNEDAEDGPTGTRATHVRYTQADGWEYRNGNSGSWMEWTLPEGLEERRIFLVYSADARWEVDTVDTSDTIQIGVYDYNDDRYYTGDWWDGEWIPGVNEDHTLKFSESTVSNYLNPNKWTSSNTGTNGDKEGGVLQDIVQDTLGSDGYPLLADGDWWDWNPDRNESLDYLFNLESDGVVDGTDDANYLFQRDADGYYYYDSAVNQAYLDGSRFRVYNTPNNGNFNPFADEDSAYAGLNVHFGMEISTQFLMPKDGQVNGQDMVFEFSGDDDVWVFVDDVLVLDMGGIHGKCTGSINFATGKVNIDLVNQGEKSLAEAEEYDISQLFRDAGKTWDDSDYQNHTLKFFYFERGGNVSNCMIRFNLPVVPQNSLLVGKDLAAVDESDQVTDDVQSYLNNLEFLYRVWKADSDQSDNADLFIAPGTEYTIYDMNSMEPVGTGTVDENGIITIHGGQFAAFEDAFDADSGSYVVEELINSSFVNQYKGVEVVGAGGITSTGKDVEIAGEQFRGFVSPAQSAEEDQTNVIFQNQYDMSQMAMLKITKDVVGTLPEDNQNGSFYFQVYLGDETGANGEPLSAGTSYTVDRADGTTDQMTTGREGLIVLQDGDTATLPLLAGMEYYVVETDADGDPIQDQADVWTVQYDNNRAGTVELQQTVSTTVTNTFPTTNASLTIIKDIYGLTADQVEKLVDGSYREDGGLRFDVDYFEEKNHLISDEKDEVLPDDWQQDHPGSTHWNAGDWTFDVVDTLNDNPFPAGSSHLWEGEITTGSGSSIPADEGGHYVGSEVRKWVQGDYEETFYRYIITIEDLNVQENNWYRVWETHVDVDGYTLETSVAEMYTGEGDESLGNLLDTTEGVDNHGGRATAFELTGDTTVHFTNRYSQGQLDLTKNVTVSGQTDNTGTTQFEFEIRIPAKWADRAEYNTGKYPVTYARKDVEETQEDESQTVHTDEDGLLQFTIESGNTGYAKATIQLYAGETAHIKLPTGIEVIVTEPNHDGYSVNWTIDGQNWVNNTGEENSAKVSIPVGDEKAVTCTNTTGAVLPSTGGPGVANILTLGTLLTLGAGAVLLLQRRRKEGDAC